MQILYVTDAFAVWGGIERVLTDKINYLIEHNEYKVCLLTASQGSHSMPYELYHMVCHVDLGIRIQQQYDYHGINRLFKVIKLNQLLKIKIKETVDTFKPDVIVCAKLDFVGVLIDIKGNIPLIVESHTLYISEYIDGSGWLRKIHVWMWKQMIRKMDAVVTLSKGDAKEWRKKNENVYVIPNVVHLNNNERYSSCQNKSVIFVGRFSKQKDINSLLAIWHLIYKKHPDWRLDIYGDGELKDEYLPVIYEMDSNINVYDPTKDIMERYLEHSILLMTSIYEPFGLVLPEAMSCGLPVVAFDCPYGPADIITNGVDGFLIKNRDIDAFVDKVCLLIENEDLRKQMGQNGVLSSQRYRADIIMPKWIELFKQLTSSQ